MVASVLGWWMLKKKTGQQCQEGRGERVELADTATVLSIDELDLEARQESE